jgi:hypothetical protein
MSDKPFTVTKEFARELKRIDEGLAAKTTEVSALANTKRNDSRATDEQTLSYDIEVLHEIARQVNWDAVHGPKWMKAGRFSPGPGLGSPNDLSSSDEQPRERKRSR